MPPRFRLNRAAKTLAVPHRSYSLSCSTICQPRHSGIVLEKGQGLRNLSFFIRLVRRQRLSECTGCKSAPGTPGDPADSLNHWIVNETYVGSDNREPERSMPSPCVIDWMLILVCAPNHPSEKAVFFRMRLRKSRRMTHYQTVL